MNRESDYYLEKARRDLDEARKIMQISLPNVAARSAYYAVFHAAEAVIFDKTGRVAKTHRGVRVEFARVSKDDPRFPTTMTAFLAKVYGYKEISDYNVDPDVIITMQDAEDAILGAEQFVNSVISALA